MPHKIEISDKTYGILKDFCTLNKLKIGQYTDKLIYDALMIEMYGDVPFTNYKKPVSEIKEVPIGEMFKAMEEKAPQENIPPEIAQVIQDHWFEMLDNVENKKEIIEEKERVEDENPQTYTTSPEDEKEIQKEMLKQLGVPDKVVNKITRRRLK